MIVSILMLSKDLLWKIISNQQLSHPQIVETLCSDLRTISDNEDGLAVALILLKLEYKYLRYN